MNGNTKRLRVFAGPNGSGKTTLYEIVSKKCNLGFFVNADIIEKTLNDTNKVNFSDWELVLDSSLFLDTFKKSSLFNLANGVKLIKELYFEGNNIQLNKFQINSYFAAFIAEYIREQLLLSGKTFTIETVLSDSRKLNFLRMAKDNGYRLYLYYITTRNPRININRVKARVELKGHSVPSEKIEKRYYKSLENLFNALLIADRGFLFDNSYSEPQLIAEKNDTQIENKLEYVPEWHRQYVLNKL